MTTRRKSATTTIRRPVGPQVRLAGGDLMLHSLRVAFLAGTRAQAVVKLHGIGSNLSVLPGCHAPWAELNLRPLAAELGTICPVVRHGAPGKERKH